MSKLRDETPREISEHFDEAMVDYSKACAALKAHEAELKAREASDAGRTVSDEWRKLEAIRSEAAAKCREAFEDILAKIAVLS